MARNALNFLCAVFASMALVSCGGGGGGDGGNSPTPPAPVVVIPVVVIATAKVELDPGLPASLAAAITEVITPAGSASYGSPVPVTTNTQNGQTLVIAVDANGNILAAATDSSRDIKLSAASTATALVRLGMGDLTGASAGATIDASIAAQPTFAAFVTSVSNAMARGSPPIEDPIVQQQLSQLVALLAAPAKAVSSGASSLAIVEPRLTFAGPLPATLVPDRIGIFPFRSPVELTGSAAGKVFIANRMMIPWAVSTTDVNGAPLQAPPVVFAARASGEVAASPPGFNILVAQNEATQREIAADLIVRFLKTVLPFTPTPSCDNAALKAAVTSILKTAPAPLSGDALVSAVQNFFALDNMIKIGASCAPEGRKLSEILKPIANLLSVWSKAKGVSEGVSLIAHSQYAYVYWGRRWPYGVCQSAASVVISCAATYELTPSPLYMAPTASVSTTLTARDADGTFTLPSGELIASTSNVATIDPKTYRVTANSVGSVTLTLTDQATDKKAELPVTVVIPQVSPATVTVAPGQLFTLRMTDSQGRLVTTPPGTTWSVSGPNASNVRAFTLLDSNIASWIVDSNSPSGSLTVTANAPDGFAYSETSKAEITIRTSGATGVNVSILTPSGSVDLEGLFNTGLSSQDLFVDRIGVAISIPVPAGFDFNSGTFTYASQRQINQGYFDYTLNNRENDFKVVVLNFTGSVAQRYTFTIDRDQSDPATTVNCVGRAATCVTGTYVAVYEYPAQSPPGFGTAFLKTQTVPGRWRGDLR